MQRARVFWTRRAFATVAAITTTSGAAWCWRIADVDGTALEESDEFFPTITTALAAGRRRLTFREQPDDPVGPAGDRAGVAVAEGPDAPRERQRPALTATRDDLARPRARSVRRPLQSCETVRQGARNALRLRGFVSGQSTGHKPRVDPAV